MNQSESTNNDMNNQLQLVGAVDQGTSSSRFLIFNAKTAKVVTCHQISLPNYYPNEGWVEQDPKQIIKTVQDCIDAAVQKLTKMKISKSCVKAIGITNQRETTIVWNKETGAPLHNAIVWCDNRTQKTVEKLIQKTSTKSQDHFRESCGLPISTYFSAVKMCWLMDNKPDIKDAINKGTALFGTVDTWLLYNLTGGANNGVFCTDITNASRTMLLNINTQKWDEDLLSFFDIPRKCLPEVRSNAEHYGYMVGMISIYFNHLHQHHPQSSGPLKGVSVCGCLGDQQAAMVGQTCFKRGDAKNTYGTGCFLLQNVGEKPVQSFHGLLSTIGYKLGKDKPTVYALEGSIAVAGNLIKWLRDNLGIIQNSCEIEKLAAASGSSKGLVLVPAFSGLYAPHWRSDARGTICGITQFHTKSHIAFAALEAICFQTREIIEAMRLDDGSLNSSDTPKLQVDGGMTENKLLMQLQADILGCTVVKPEMPETTALGAAMAAGIASGVWNLEEDDLSTIIFESFHPSATKKDIDVRYEKWKLAVEKSKGWNFAEQPNHQACS